MKHAIMSSALLAFLVLASPAFAQTEPNQDLNELYGQGKKDQALTLAIDRLTTAPDDRDLNLMAGRCLVDLRRVGEGAPYLQKVVATSDRDWQYAWALNYLAYIAWTEGDDETARKAWIEVRDGALTQNVARNAANNLRFFALDKEFAAWRRVTTAHGIFHFGPGHDEQAEKDFADVHESAYVLLTDIFGGRPPMPVRYVVWSSLEEAKSLAGIESLGFARPEHCVIQCRWDQTVGHELTHVISYHALRPTTRTPLMNEGLAVCYDLSSRDRMATARRAVRESGLTELDLVAWWGDKAPVPESVFYPVAGAWVQTLRDRGGMDRFFDLCREQTVDKARALYGDDLDVWMAEFSVAVLAKDGGD